MRSILARACLALVWLSLLQAGCLPVFRGAPAGTGQEPGSVLFADDFSDPPSGWGTWNRGGALVEYRDGGLRILVDETQADFWSVAGQKFSDVQVEVDALLLAGPADNDYGIICRYQDRDNFYMLVISSDGYYGAAKRKGGQYSMIGTDQLQYSDAIAQGQAANHLRADCAGDRLRLYANGRQLLEVRDADFNAGDVGLIAGAYAAKGVDVWFDNFVVKAAGQEPNR
jgi:hypothetical protein